MAIPKDKTPLTVREIKDRWKEQQAEIFSSLNARRSYLKKSIERCIDENFKAREKAAARFIRRCIKDCGESNIDVDFAILEKFEFVYPVSATDPAFYRYNGSNEIPQQAARVLIRNDFDTLAPSHRVETVPEYYKTRRKEKRPHPLHGKNFPDSEVMEIFEIASGREFTFNPPNNIRDLESELVDSGALLGKIRGRRGTIKDSDMQFAASIVEGYQRHGDTFTRPSKKQVEQWQKERTHDVNAPRKTQYLNSNEMGDHIASYDNGPILPPGVQDLGTFNK